jgi:hypothetical protein
MFSVFFFSLRLTVLIFLWICTILVFQTKSLWLSSTPNRINNTDKHAYIKAKHTKTFSGFSCLSISVLSLDRCTSDGHQLSSSQIYFFFSSFVFSMCSYHERIHFCLYFSLAQCCSDWQLRKIHGENRPLSPE